MNARIAFFAAAMAASSAFCGVANATTTSQDSTPVPYHYGMALNVAKVISMTEPDTLECKVVTAEMKFVDTAGQHRDISYSKLSDACSMQD